jgi:sugar phosphate isomerase/epimerase
MRLSVQLFTVRDELARDFDGTLAALRETGLEQVELAGFAGRTPEEFGEALRRHGLRAGAAHVAPEDVESRPQELVREHAAIGVRDLIIPWIGRERYAEGWRPVGEWLERLGRGLAEHGGRLHYHNHAFEFAWDGCASGFDTMLQNADPELVKAEIDIAWVQIAGHDPGPLIRRLADRIQFVHLKDFDPAATPQWVPCGQGRVDWDVVIEACEAAGVEAGVIELDESPHSSLDAVRESVRFLHTLGLR